MKLRSFAVAVSVALTESSPAGAQTPTTAEAVMARYFAVVGGEQAIRGIKNRYISMTSTSPRGAQSRAESWIRQPNKVFTRTTTAGFGVTEAGYDGKTGWSLSKLGATILPDDQAKRMHAQASLDPVLRNWTKLTLRGRTNVGGKPAYVVEGVVDTLKITQYFDVASGLLVGMDLPGQNIPKKPGMLMRNYRRFGPVLMATLMVIRMPSDTDSVVTRIERVDHAPIHDSMFALPSAVRALLRPPTG